VNAVRRVGSRTARASRRHRCAPVVPSQHKRSHHDNPHAAQSRWFDTAAQAGSGASHCGGSGATSPSRTRFRPPPLPRGCALGRGCGTTYTCPAPSVRYAPGPVTTYGCELGYGCGYGSGSGGT
jgi:hypothetical protein